MGNTFSFLTGESDALEGVSHRGRTSPLHCPAARRREDGWPLSGIRYFPQDRQPRRADRPQPAAVSAREPASDADREADCAAEERVSTLGRPEDPGETQAAVSRPAVPGISTVHAVLDRQGLVTRRRRRRYKGEGTALSRPATPNELWCADYKGEFMLADRRYCYPLTITDFASRYLITCDALATTKETYTFTVFERAFRLCCNFRAATSGWTTFGKHRTGSPIMPSDNPFKWRQFEPALILQGVRWYLRYALSYRDLEDMMRERGLCVDHTTIYRWVQRYAPEIDKRCRPFLRRTNDSYRIDETYVRVAGAWTYLYRGVDSNGDTLDFLLRATRDRKAAIAFFRKTLGAAHTTPPRVVTVDKNPAYPVAFEAVRHEGLVRPRSNLRQCKYLNNIIEQDHRFIKRRTRPMLGFKRFTTAWRTLRGIEIMHALRKGQARWMAKGDVVGQTQLIHKVFGLAA